MLGNVELAYLSGLTTERRKAMYDKLLSSKIPCIVFCRGQEPGEDVLALCCHYGVPCLSSAKPTSDVMGGGDPLVKGQAGSLHPASTAVLVDVFGEGVLITGESGIGKSEAALELIKRGHRLVSDDVVEIRKVSDETLVGSAPDITKYFIELRGIGIIDVKTLFGVESVKDTQSINMVIRLEEWDKSKEYDRLGMEDQYTEFLGNKVICHDIPIRPGRNLR